MSRVGTVVLDRQQPGDIGTLYEAWGRWPGTRYWSLRGRAPSPLLIANTFADPDQDLRVLRDPDGHPLGVVGIHGLAEPGGFADLDFMVTDDPHVRDAVRTALCEAVAGAFAAVPVLRKLVVEAYADHLPDLAPFLGDLPHLAGVLTDHAVTDDGSFVDLHIYEVMAWTGSHSPS